MTYNPSFGPPGTPNPAQWYQYHNYLGQGYATARQAAARQAVAEQAVAAAPTLYGAVARSSTSRFGWSWGQPDRETAEQKAIKECDHSDAVVIVWASNAYIAVATGENGAYGWAWGANEERATEKALAGCRAYSANSKILVTFHT
jgi:hypothetical protein